VPEIQSLARGLKILDLLAQSESGLSIGEVAHELGIDKSSALRLLQTLSAYGFTEKDTHTYRYSLGFHVVSLSRAILARIPLVEVARPYLKMLVEKTGECAHLGILFKDRVLYVDQVESPATLRVNAEVGQTAPLYCTALGKVILAFSDYPTPTKMQSFTKNTLIELEMLQKNLKKIQEQGYALDEEEFDLGVRCLAVPVFDFNKKLIGSVGISGPASRLTFAKLKEVSLIVLEVGQELSNRM
jgi:IclR family transcriptional regulator, KDG regulon repressor